MLPLVKHDLVQDKALCTYLSFIILLSYCFCKEGDGTRLLHGYYDRSVKDIILKICVLETVVLKVTPYSYSSTRKSKKFSLLQGNKYFYSQSN